MSEERTGPEPGERDDIDELIEDNEEEESGFEPEPDDTEPAEPEPEPEPEPQTRGRRRIQRQQSELQELREDKRRLMDLLSRQPAQPQYQAPLPDPTRQVQLDREERERVAQMPFEEQGLYWADKRTREVNQRIALSELRTADMLDQHNFRQIMRERRLPAKYATEVETVLSQARQNGMNPSREDVLYRVIGREVMERQDRETERQQARGQRRIASQRTRPGGASQSTAAARIGRRDQNQAAEDEALLRGATVGEVMNRL